MKPSSQPPRTPLKLSDSVHHQLNMYALAASAAGVGLLALAPPAEGKIVYTRTVSQLVNHGFNGLDLNHDRFYDFRFPVDWGINHSGSGSEGAAILSVGPLQKGNQIWESLAYPQCAAYLPGGQKVGSSGNFHSGVLIMGLVTFHMRASGGRNSCGWGGQAAMPIWA